MYYYTLEVPCELELVLFLYLAQYLGHNKEFAKSPIANSKLCGPTQSSSARFEVQLSKSQACGCDCFSVSVSSNFFIIKKDHLLLQIVIENVLSMVSPRSLS